MSLQNSQKEANVPFPPDIQELEIFQLQGQPFNYRFCPSTAAGAPLDFHLAIPLTARSQSTTLKLSKYWLEKWGCHNGNSG